jgi:hypothetical protein
MNSDPEQPVIRYKHNMTPDKTSSSFTLLSKEEDNELCPTRRVRGSRPAKGSGRSEKKEKSNVDVV